MTNALLSLTSEALLEKTDRLVVKERRITAELLLYFAEIERRRLHLEMGYPSLFELLTQKYRYSEGAASRRIAAARLVNEIPEAAPSIESGGLSLCVVSQMGHFFKAEKKLGKSYTQLEKKELTLKMEGLSRRSCERQLLEISPQALLPKERERPVTSTDTEIRFIANEQLLAKLEKLKQLMGHLGEQSYAELFDRLSDFALKKLDPEQQVSRRKSCATATVNAMPKSDEISKTPPVGLSATVSLPTNESAQKTPSRKYRRAISAADRRIAWQRAQGSCEYTDPKTKKRCHSKWALEVDHILAIARGGKNELANYRLCCRQHNQLYAIREFGTPFMEQFLNQSRGLVV